MDARTIIFYVALLVIAGAVAELYVRINGIGANLAKVKGTVVATKPRLGPTFLFLLAAIIAAAATIPH